MYYSNLTALKFSLLLVRDVETGKCCDGHLFLAANAGLTLASIKVMEDYIQLSAATVYHWLVALWLLWIGTSPEGVVLHNCSPTSTSARRIPAGFFLCEINEEFPLLWRSCL